MKGSALVNRVQPSPNHEVRFNAERPRHVVLHYTGMKSGAAAVDWLCDPASKVSCHYLVDVDGSIVQMVDENLRAWHAGVSSWNQRTDLNSASIGIEIQNLGHSGGLPPFPRVQMLSVSRLCLDIMLRWGLSPEDVVAHSDVAPGRKIDPGEAFDWRWLAEQGIGNLVVAQSSSTIASIAETQKMLADLGYGIELTGELDSRTRLVIEAFQRRYRSRLIDGKIDAETTALLVQLLAVSPFSSRTA